MIEQKLSALGFELPTPPAPVANYVPYIVTGNLIFISGQLPILNGVLQHTGAVTEANLEEGKQAAQLSALNLIAQLKAASQNQLDKVTRCIRLAGFVNCHAGFTKHPQIMNSASELIVNLWGEAGRHCRTAVGCCSLPLDAMIEIEAVFEIK